jgi:hypothetical protein
MSSPEDAYLHPETKSEFPEATREDKKHEGLASLLIGGVLFATGALATKYALEVSGKEERMTDTKQALTIATGGLAAAATVLRKTYKNHGINHTGLFQRRSNQSRAQRERLLSWKAGPSELGPEDDKVIARFRAELDNPDIKF